jgi:PAS domain S-box-containing protein
METDAPRENIASRPDDRSELARLRIENEFLRAQVAHVGLWDWDLVNNRVDYSDQWKRQLGLESDEIGDTLREWEDRLHPGDREHVIEIVRLCTRTPRYGFDLTLRMRHKDGRWIWINSRGFNASTEDGVICRMFGTHIDVTAYKTMESKLLKAEKKQRMAKELAERENLAKSSFLAAVSHEIRTPINGILGVLQMLRMTRELDRDKLEKLVEMGESSGKRILRVIGESLDIARIEAGRLELIHEAVDLALLLESMRSFKSKQAAEMGLELRWQVAADVPRRILIDPVRLRQVLENLLGNAFKYTREGFVSFEASMVKRPKDQAASIRFVVSDSGIGFSKKFGRTIFEPFTQGLDNFQSSDHGTGMGLAKSRFPAAGASAVILPSPFRQMISRSRSRTSPSGNLRRFLRCAGKFWWWTMTGFRPRWRS